MNRQLLKALLAGLLVAAGVSITTAAPAAAEDGCIGEAAITAEEQDVIDLTSGGSYVRRDITAAAATTCDRLWTVIHTRAILNVQASGNRVGTYSSEPDYATNASEGFAARGTNGCPAGTFRWQATGEHKHIRYETIEEGSEDSESETITTMCLTLPNIGGCLPPGGCRAPEDETPEE